MAEPQTNPAEKTSQAEKTKHRSPAYPFVSLKKAIERAGEFYEKEHRHAAPITSAAKHWGYGEKSSGGIQTISALKQFGLLGDDGSGNARSVKLTDAALAILLDEVKDSPERAAAVKRAALRPKLYADMFAQWGVQLPSDETIRTFLRRDKGFNDDVLTGVIKNYKETLHYAKLSSSDTIPQSDGQDTLPSLGVGDYVAWESQGVLQFEAAKVTGFSADRAYVFVEGTTTGIPMDQVTKAEPPDPPPLGAHVPPGDLLPQRISKPPAPQVGISREVSSLPEGEAALQWPATLSAESVGELEAWLKLVVTKLKRRFPAEPKS